MENKWKKFAVDFFLSSYNGDASDVYDKLSEADYSEFPILFEELEIEVWVNFENEEQVTVVQYIVDLAESAKHTADNL